MTLAHLRTYTVKEGRMDSWLKLFKEKLAPLMEEHGIKIEGTWVSEDESQFIWVRSYGETQAELEAKEAAFYGSDWWVANVDHVRGHLSARDIKRIKSV